ncbi:MAG: sulfite exporter TauE/SafE family protein [Saprospiraceae bacterium]|nr:sulfite exporter TauE/SafE family protein [Saprospiraceae bacterium]
MVYQELTFYICLFWIAYLYASVGHGGASGYLAIMGLFAVSAVTMRPSALLLNCLVSLIAFIQYYRAGHFQWKFFIPFAITSVPAAFWGGTIQLDEFIYKKILAILLVVSIIQLLKSNKQVALADLKPAPFYYCMIIGTIIGFISGLIGIGGGIILSPLLLFLHWATIKQTSATAALFIFVNSVAGIFGIGIHALQFHPHIFLCILLVAVGGFIGAYAGAFKHNEIVLKRILAFVLCIAVFKLLMS